MLFFRIMKPLLVGLLLLVCAIGIWSFGRRRKRMWVILLRSGSVVHNGMGFLRHSFEETVFTISNSPGHWTRVDCPAHACHNYPTDDTKEFRCQPQWLDAKIRCAAYVPDNKAPMQSMPQVQKFHW